MKIAVIGSGNVATQLALALLKAGHTITTVYSRNKINSSSLAIKTNSRLSKDLNDYGAAKLILIAVNDDSIATVASHLKVESQIVVHTSGSADLNVLKKFKNSGVFYPLQTINKNSKINFKKIPICVEAINKLTEKKLIDVAKSISNKIYLLTSEQRRSAHLAAVFANNFSNHLFAIAEEILSENNLPFDLVRPLIKETAKKAQTVSPSFLQTGPAKRNDLNTIQNHLKLLKNSETQKEIYDMMSKSIQKKVTLKTNLGREK